MLALYVYVQMWVKYKMSSPEPRFWILFTALEKKVDFFSRAVRQNPERKAWVRGYSLGKW